MKGNGRGGTARTDSNGVDLPTISPRKKDGTYLIARINRQRLTRPIRVASGQRRKGQLARLPVVAKSRKRGNLPHEAHDSMHLLLQQRTNTLLAALRSPGRCGYTHDYRPGLWGGLTRDPGRSGQQRRIDPGCRTGPTLLANKKVLLVPTARSFVLSL